MKRSAAVAIAAAAAAVSLSFVRRTAAPSGRGNVVPYDSGQALEVRRLAVPLAAALHGARRALHERVDGRGLLEDGGRLGAGGVVSGEPLLELLGVVLVVLEGARDFRLAGRPAQRGPLELSVEVALELVAPLIDLVDECLHVLVGQALGDLSKAWNRPQGQGAYENDAVRGD